MSKAPSYKILATDELRRMSSIKQRNPVLVTALRRIGFRYI